ncbi:hypothetical protein HY493_05835 [Candidatus Woesearchaeota archaeon]|nr:hypothetical protein [Candidatus Woesearchaeota archaeon]
MMSRNQYRILAFVMIALMLASVPVAASPQSSGLGSFFSWLSGLFSGSPTGAVIGATCADDSRCDVVLNGEYCDGASGTCAAQQPFPSVDVRRSTAADSILYDPSSLIWAPYGSRISLRLMNDGATDWTFSVSAGSLYVASATFPSPGLATLTIRPGDVLFLQTYQDGLVQVVSGTSIIGSNYNGDGNKYNAISLVQSSSSSCGSNPPTIGNYQVQPNPPVAGSTITLTVYVNDLDNQAPCAGGQTFSADAQIISQPMGSTATLGIAPPPSTTSFAWSLVGAGAGTYVIEVTVTDSTGRRTTQQISFDVVASTSSYYPPRTVYTSNFLSTGATLNQQIPDTFIFSTGEQYVRASLEVRNNGPSTTGTWRVTSPDLNPVTITLNYGDTLRFSLASDGSGSGQITLVRGGTTLPDANVGILPLRGPVNFQQGGCSPTQSQETFCNDGVDNDCNGMTDCADSRCAMTAECGGTTATLSVMPSIARIGETITVEGSGFQSNTPFTLEAKSNGPVGPIAIRDTMSSPTGTFQVPVIVGNWWVEGDTGTLRLTDRGVVVASTPFTIARREPSGCTSTSCGAGTVCDTGTGSCVNSVSSVINNAIASGKSAVWAYTQAGWTGKTLAGAIHAFFGSSIKGSSVGYFAKADNKWGSYDAGSLSSAPSSVCGNGMIDPGEQCEPSLPPTCSPTTYCGAACQCLPQTSSGCASDADCPATQPNCDLATRTCVSGGTGGCPAGTLQCGTSCVDTSRDTVNCGSCGNICPGTTDICSGGVCTPSGAPNCDDGKPCTRDYFDGISCVNDPRAYEGMPCDNLGRPGTCMAGTCR